jgi:Putative bacterial sensory transduction regulator
MRPLFILTAVLGVSAGSAAVAQDTGKAISDGLAALLGGATQGGDSGQAGGGNVVSAPPLAGGMVDATSPQVIANLMQQAGYRAVVTTDNVGDPKIESSAAGADFSIYFYGCENARNCLSIQFSSGYDMPNGVSLQTVNDWNATKRFSFAYLDNENDPFLSYDVNLYGGVTEQNFLESLALWDTILADFHTHIDW